MIIALLLVVFGLCIYMAVLANENNSKIQSIEFLIKEMDRFIKIPPQKEKVRKDPEEYRKEEQKVLKRLYVRKSRKKREAAKIDSPFRRDQAEAASG